VITIKLQEEVIENEGACARVLSYDFVVLGFNSFEQRKQGNDVNKEIATLKTANQ
jgi:hypothetical protein